MNDKEAKFRDLKRQNFQLQSSVKQLESQLDNLHEKLESINKERIHLRKELVNMTHQNNGVNIDSIDMNTTATSATSHSSTASNTKSGDVVIVSSSGRTISTEILEEKASFKSNSLLNLPYWNELNASSSWDVNYNTGKVHKYVLGQSRPTEGNDLKKENHTSYFGSIASDLNAIINNTPRSHR